jgi:hypothetical protein
MIKFMGLRNLLASLARGRPFCQLPDQFIGIGFIFISTNLAPVFDIRTHIYGPGWHRGPVFLAANQQYCDD